MVGAAGSDELLVSGGAEAGDLQPLPVGQFHGVRADSTARASDQQTLPRGQVEQAQHLRGGRRVQWQGRS
ncbi:hypothetical protein ACIQNT_31925 [Streptomyces luteogriseus]|uniref:hypothetical protein n=1 Tax=Streptomyces luteogriseus TaxID=68233 RepID=UPI0038152EFE